MDGDARALLTDLTCRGFRLRAEGDRLVVAPASRLSEADRQRIRQHRDVLLACLRADALATSWRGVEAYQPAWGWIALRDPATGRWYEIRWRDAPQWLKDRATGDRAGRHKEAV